MFQFKQFCIKQDQCAMKVGTDGVLLGAWSSADEANHILDVGCGTGLISLMLAQRSPTANITGVEIDEKAAEQATQNVKASPFSARITIRNIDFQQMNDNQLYDLIVSNPPYFQQSLKSAGHERNLARHNDSFSYEAFFGFASVHLKKNGRLSVIIPSDLLLPFLSLAKEQSLFLTRKTNIFPTPEKEIKRYLLEFSPTYSPCTSNNLIIETSRHCYTDEYKMLTRNFYLKF